MSQVFNTPVYDYIIIGSGFGGSVSAMRLSEKGYKVLVLEQGKWYKDEDFPESDWNLKKYLWKPAIGFHGIMKLDFFKPVFVLSGTGVGGGSLVYAATLLEPPDEFYQQKVWPADINWKQELAPSYIKAKKMLGVSRYNQLNIEDDLLRDVAREMDVADTFRAIDTGIYFGDKDVETDPYFNGEGPLRKGCSMCASCMTGCRDGSKNSLDKNYLFFAQKNGAEIKDLCKADKISFSNGEYEIEAYSTKNKKDKYQFRSKGLVVSASVLGTLELLLKQKNIYKTLPNLSDSLGTNVRTNSESLSGIVNSPYKLNNGPAITSMFSPEPGTWVQPVKFNDRSGAVTHLSGFAVNGRTPLIRVFNLLAKTIRYPLKAIRAYTNFRWCKNSIVFMAMQCNDSSMSLELRKRFGKYKLSFPKENSNVPAFIKSGQQALFKYAEKTKATPFNCITELLLNKASTAHIIGGCPMGEDGTKGVVDDSFNVHNYPNMMVIDSSIIPCNIGVNPSLTITALAEYAMSKVDEKNSHQ